MKVEDGVFPEVQKDLSQYVLVTLKTNLGTTTSRKWKRLLNEEYGSTGIPRYSIHSPQGELIEKLDFDGVPSVSEMREFLRRNQE